MAIDLRSNNFENGGIIPKKYSYDGSNESPHLAWSSIPEGAKSLAIICEDPDAPVGIWVHWIIYNLPAELEGISEDFPKQKKFSNGVEQGLNDFQYIGYGGPKPPSGTHRYIFKIFALDKVLDIEAGVTKEELLEVMKGHVVDEGSLVGKFCK